MSHALHPDMSEVTRLTRAGRLTEATTLLQSLLGRGVAPGGDGGAPHADGAEAAAQDGPSAARTVSRPSRVIDIDPETGEPEPGQARSPAGGSSHPSRPTMPPEATPPGMGRMTPGMVPQAGTLVPAALRGFLDRFNPGSATAGTPGAASSTARPAPEPAAGGRFVARSFSGAAGTRTYKLYIPPQRSDAAMPLIVMLHGCTQSPDDFAAGTRMNALASEHGFLVAYPAQPPAANAQKCWNWFNPSDQRRGEGEPSLIAGITDAVIRDHTVDRRRVYVAGLSAGGATAAIMGHAYPDIYAAVGVHSGLACGAARDMASAFAAMRQGASAAPLAPHDFTMGERRFVPTIVFHADRDATVHPRNADQVVAQAQAAAALGLRTETETGQVPNGHSYRRIVHRDADGNSVLEQWLVHGGGHAWSGGAATGSYTDPLGPDASREMVRFFLQHASGGAG
jgi:poly(hydroxyalkanoate) depolymerase family esterase